MATLLEPIMQLLVEDEDHLEIDPNKLTKRFSPTQPENSSGRKAQTGSGKGFRRWWIPMRPN